MNVGQKFYDNTNIDQPAENVFLRLGKDDKIHFEKKKKGTARGIQKIKVFLDSKLRKECSLKEILPFVARKVAEINRLKKPLSEEEAKEIEKAIKTINDVCNKQITKKESKHKKDPHYRKDEFRVAFALFQKDSSLESIKGQLISTYEFLSQDEFLLSFSAAVDICNEEGHDELREWLYDSATRVYGTSEQRKFFHVLDKIAEKTPFIISKGDLQTLRNASEVSKLVFHIKKLKKDAFRSQMKAFLILAKGHSKQEFIVTRMEAQAKKLGLRNAFYEAAIESGLLVSTEKMFAKFHPKTKIDKAEKERLQIKLQEMQTKIKIADHIRTGKVKELINTEGKDLSKAYENLEKFIPTTATERLEKKRLEREFLEDLLALETDIKISPPSLEELDSEEEEEVQVVKKENIEVGIGSLSEKKEEFEIEESTLPQSKETTPHEAVQKILENPEIQEKTPFSLIVEYANIAVYTLEEEELTILSKLLQDRWASLPESFKKEKLALEYRKFLIATGKEIDSSFYGSLPVRILLRGSDISFGGLQERQSFCKALESKWSELTLEAKKENVLQYLEFQTKHSPFVDLDISIIQNLVDEKFIKKETLLIVSYLQAALKKTSVTENQFLLAKELLQKCVPSSQPLISISDVQKHLEYVRTTGQLTEGLKKIRQGEYVSGISSLKKLSEDESIKGFLLNSFGKYIQALEPDRLLALGNALIDEKWPEGIALVIKNIKNKVLDRKAILFCLRHAMVFADFTLFRGTKALNLKPYEKDPEVQSLIAQVKAVQNMERTQCSTESLDEALPLFINNPSDLIHAVRAIHFRASQEFAEENAMRTSASQSSVTHEEIETEIIETIEDSREFLEPNELLELAVNTASEEECLRYEEKILAVLGIPEEAEEKIELCIRLILSEESPSIKGLEWLAQRHDKLTFLVGSLIEHKRFKEARDVFSKADLQEDEKKELEKKLLPTVRTTPHGAPPHSMKKETKETFSPVISPQGAIDQIEYEKKKLLAMRDVSAATDAFFKGNYVIAKSFYMKALANNPVDADALEGLASLCDKEGGGVTLEDAIDYLTKAQKQRRGTQVEKVQTKLQELLKKKRAKLPEALEEQLKGLEKGNEGPNSHQEELEKTSHTRVLAEERMGLESLEKKKKVIEKSLKETKQKKMEAQKNIEKPSPHTTDTFHASDTSRSTDTSRREVKLANSEEKHKTKQMDSVLDELKKKMKRSQDQNEQ